MFQVVIVVEGTQSTKFLLGIIIAVLCAKWVADILRFDGVYESDLEADGSVCFLPTDPPPSLYSLTAGQVIININCQL